MKATYVSIWDGGVRVETNCEFNPETKEVTDVDSVDVDGVDICDEEFIELPDGTEIKTFKMDGQYWVDGQVYEEVYEPYFLNEIDFNNKEEYDREVLIRNVISKLLEDVKINDYTVFSELLGKLPDETLKDIL